MTNGPEERMLRVTHGQWDTAYRAGATSIKWPALEPVPIHSDAEYDELKATLKRWERNGIHAAIQADALIHDLRAQRDELQAKLGELEGIDEVMQDKIEDNNQSIELAQLNFSFFSSKITIEKVCGYCRFCTRHYCVKREMHLTDDYLYSLGCDYFKSKV